jgi:hypothetical protein
MHSPDYWNINEPTSTEKIAIIDNEQTGQGDVLLKDICDQAKIGANATIYTIGFELAGEPIATAALEDCASSLSTHYVVDGAELSTAFRNIALEIVTLKLIMPSYIDTTGGGDGGDGGGCVGFGCGSTTTSTN